MDDKTEQLLKKLIEAEERKADALERIVDYLSTIAEIMNYGKIDVRNEPIKK